MSDLVKITGFKELQTKLKKLPDNIKKREVNKILGQVANPVLKAMRSLTKSGSPTLNGHPRTKRQVGKTIIEEKYLPGYGKKTIAKAVMRKSKNPFVVVGPRTRKGKEGYFLRQWVIPGTRFFAGSNATEKAFYQTKNKMTADAEIRIAKYIRKQIDKL